MTILVKPHTEQEEQKLLAFLDSMKYDYVQDSETGFLSAEQEAEILKRDHEFEDGKAETFSLQEIMAHFNIEDK